MAKFKVAVDAGHGGSNSTPGKRTPDGEYEWNFNDVVVRAGIAVLKANGVDVLRTDDASGKTDIGLTARTNKANAWGADVYWSAHHNALTGIWINHEMGIETFTQNGTHKEAERLANVVHPKYVKAMGLKSRGIKKQNLAITRQTSMPAILTEGGFMDSLVDIVAMRDDAKLKAQGEAIAEGILEYLGVKNTKKPNTHTPTKPSVKPVTVKPSTSAPKPSTSKWTKVNGKWTGQSLFINQYGQPVGEMQQALSNNKPPFYPNKGAKNNGIDKYFGNDTKNQVERYQTHYKLKVDGIPGKEVYAQIQKNKADKTVTKPKATSKPKANLKVDSQWGKAVTKELQKDLKVVVDGEIWGQIRNQATQAIYSGVKFGSGGSPMIKALQRKIGMTGKKVDGYFGAESVRFLQKYLGTSQDGKITRPRSTMVKKLQERLNAGTF